MATEEIAGYVASQIDRGMGDKIALMENAPTGLRSELSEGELESAIAEAREAEMFKRIMPYQ